MPYKKEKSRWGIVRAILAVLISGSTLFGEIMPFGIALYAANFGAVSPVFLGTIVVLSVFLPHFLPSIALKYALTLLLFSIIASKKGKVVTKTPLRRGALMGISVFSIGLFMLLGGQILLYDCFVLLLEAGITCIMTCLFANAVKAFSKKETASSPLDTLSISALTGVLILGISGFFTLYELHITVPLAVLGVLLLTHESGMTSGAVAGITIGALTTLESGLPVLGTFAAAGMAAGYFSRYGRGGTTLGFVIANAAVSFYAGGTEEMVLKLYEVAIPSLIYLSLPKGLLGTIVETDAPDMGRDRRIRTLLSEDLQEKSAAFTCLSETFSEITESKLRSHNPATASFFERTARSACDGCKKVSFCWKKEFHRTYAAFFVMLELCSKEGHLTRDDIPISLEEKCIRHDALLEAFNSMYQIYKVDKLWEARMQECRSLVARQLSCVAHIFQTMEKNVKSGIAENTALEDLLRARLCENNVSVRDVAVLEKRRGAPSVILYAADTLPDTVSSIISDVLSTPMELISARGGRYSFAPANRMHLRIFGESIPKNDSPKTGDSFDSLFLENGYYLLLLSDGMGSGKTAGMDSRAAVTMLRALFSAGFDPDTAISLVNSVLVLKSAEDSFATIDLMLVNSRTMHAEFMKVGAAASFLKRGNAVRTFSCGSLPAGILSSPDTARLSSKVEAGDMLIMISDGIADPGREAADASWLCDVIRSYNGNDPRDLSQTILRHAREKCGGHISDDMTVLCAAVCENNDFVA